MFWIINLSQTHGGCLEERRETYDLQDCGLIIILGVLLIPATFADKIVGGNEDLVSRQRCWQRSVAIRGYTIDNASVF